MIAVIITTRLIPKSSWVVRGLSIPVGKEHIYTNVGCGFICSHLIKKSIYRRSYDFVSRMASSSIMTPQSYVLLYNHSKQVIRLVMSGRPSTSRMAASPNRAFNRRRHQRLGH